MRRLIRERAVVSSEMKNNYNYYINKFKIIICITKENTNMRTHEILKTIGRIQIFTLFLCLTE